MANARPKAHQSGKARSGSLKCSALSRVSLEALHRFHSYCARFPSKVAETAIQEFSRPGESVLDPFCGSGTSLTAGLFKNRHVIGADVDILAGMLSRVKCFPMPSACYGAWRRQFIRKLRKVFCEIEEGWPDVTTSTRPGARFSVGDVVISLPNFPELKYWFPPQLSAALAGIAQAAHECRNQHYEQVALVSLSASIISKWPNTLSYAMDIDHTRPHRQIQRFYLDRVLDTYLTRLDRTIACLAGLHQAYTNAGITAELTERARVICPHDARAALPGVAEESQSLVITSPPYFNAVDYPRAHRMSVCWMNGHAPEDLASRGSYIGLHRARGFDFGSWLQARPKINRQIPDQVAKDTQLLRHLSGFFADLEKVLIQVHRVLRPGGHAVFVIGDNYVRGQRIASHVVLIELARALGFEKRSSSHRKIVSLRRRYPVGQFGFDGPMTHEFVVVLQRPRATSKGRSLMPEQSESEVLLSLHRRLVQGDRVAPAELIEILLSPLVREMKREFPRMDVHLVSDGVTDTLLDYSARPEIFDETRSVPLKRFLAKVAWRKIANLTRDEARRKTREGKAAEFANQNLVELDPPTGNPLQNATLDAQRGLEELARLLPDPRDQKIFKLKATGERRTEEFAKAMGIIHLPIEQQRHQVKKAKDRIDKIMERRKDPRL